jgi:hypothetical protein
LPWKEEVWKDLRKRKREGWRERREKGEQTFSLNPRERKQMENE